MLSLLHGEYLGVYDDVRYYLTKAIKDVALRMLEGKDKQQYDEATIKAATAHLLDMLLLVKLPAEAEFKPRLMMSPPGEGKQGDKDEEAEEEEDNEYGFLFDDSDEEEGGGRKANKSTKAGKIGGMESLATHGGLMGCIEIRPPS